MKRIITILAMVLSFSLAGSFMNKSSAQVSVGITYQDFYDGLSPYGRWIYYPRYGYVWNPSGISGFRPYSTGGHWVWTKDFGWMWMSDYDWGWATFHYGRWFYDSFYGWMWVPGYEWSPAWVMWRGGGDYYGWAPLEPGISFSIGIGFGNYSPPANYWCFVNHRYITSRRIYDHYSPVQQNNIIINNTTIINNYNRTRNVFVGGPAREEAERFTNERIKAARVREVNDRSDIGYRSNEVNVYRPAVQDNDGNRNYAPKQFDRYDKNDRREAITDNKNDNRPVRGNDNDPFERRNNQARDNNRQNSFERKDQQSNVNNNPRGNDNNPFERRNAQRPQMNNSNNNDNPFERRREMPGNRNGWNRNDNLPQRNPGNGNEMRRQFSPPAFERNNGMNPGNWRSAGENRGNGRNRRG